MACKVFSEDAPAFGCLQLAYAGCGLSWKKLPKLVIEIVAKIDCSSNFEEYYN